MLDSSDLYLLWPGSNLDDAVRRHLACILIQDPDHRLRVAHVEPLLHLSLAAQVPISSGRLQALLTDPATAKIFPVDFSTQAADWRGRVVHLDAGRLSHELCAAKQQQQQGLAAAAACEGAEAQRLQRASSSGFSDARGPAAGGDARRDPLTLGSSSAPAAPQARAAGQGDAPAAPAGSGGRPSNLESIFGSGQALGGVLAPSADGGGGASQHGSAGQAVPPNHLGQEAGGQPGAAQGSLFANSFEVPHAIASCWADHASSCGSGAGKLPHHHHHGHGQQQQQALDGMAASEGCGGSSIASGSSGRSFQALGAPHAPPGTAPGPAAAASAGAGSAGGASTTGAAAIPAARAGSAGSRLRNASSCLPDDVDVSGDAAPAPANSVDVCTPRSASGGGAGLERSPLHAGAGMLLGEADEDAEYSEAALVFGSVNNSSVAAAAVAAAKRAGDAAAGGQQLAGGAAARGGSMTGEGAAGPQQAGPDGQGPAAHGVDWSCLAALQQQQQQQHHHALLFGGGDDAPAGDGGLAPGGGRARAAPLAAAAAGALTARRLLAEQQAAAFRDDASPAGVASMLLGSGGGSGPQQHNHHLAALAGSLAGMAGGHQGPGSAPATLQHQQEQLFMAAAAAAAAGSAGSAGSGFGLIGGGGQQGLADGMLMDAEGGFAGGQHLAAFSLQGSSYGSSWGASPAAAAAMHHHLLLQQHRQQQAAAAAVVAAAAAAHNQQVHAHQSLLGSLGGGDGSVDVGFRSDQLLREPSGSGCAGSAGAGIKGGAGSFLLAAAANGGGGSGGFDAAACLDHLAAASERTSSSGGGAAGSALGGRLTGWASIAAREPVTGSSLQHQGSAGSSSVASSAAAAQQGGLKQAAVKAAAGGAGAGEAGKAAIAKLPPRVRGEVQALVNAFSGILKVEDFDDGVVHQLNAKRSEDEAVAAVRHIAHYELSTIQHMAAYLNHLVKHYNHNAAAAAVVAADGSAGGQLSLGSALAAAAAAAAAGGSAAARGGSAGGLQLLAPGMVGAGGGGGSLGSTLGGARSASGSGAAAAATAGGAGVAPGSLGAYGGQIRLASVPVSTKAMLQKLPLKVFKQVEVLVQNCPYLEWRHFDAGVIKVLAQLSKLCEADVFEELELLAATDLSNVEYMPAYLNKRLNNKLWSRRKADGHVPS